MNCSINSENGQKVDNVRKGDALKMVNSDCHLLMPVRPVTSYTIPGSQHIDALVYDSKQCLSNWIM